MFKKSKIVLILIHLKFMSQRIIYILNQHENVYQYQMYHITTKQNFLNSFKNNSLT